MTHPQEDALLRDQIEKHGGPGNWTAIAEALVGRSSKSCRLRYAREFTPFQGRGFVKRNAPIHLFHPSGPYNRVRGVTARVPRPPAPPTPASLRLSNHPPPRILLFLPTNAAPNRWCNQLNPTVKRGPFTEEEDQKILAAHVVYGNKWAVISRSIPGRYARNHPRGSPFPKFDTRKSNAKREIDWNRFDSKSRPRAFRVVFAR